jgi:phosphatidylethanolamine/phosphatidyl-N-methylethanolamine N-methyltransferase
MKINTNTWNKIRYTVYTPGYDRVARYLEASRKKSIESLTLKPGDRLLIVGAGTGLDLEFLPAHIEITATDITPAMVAKIKERNKILQRNVIAQVMDGQALTFDDQTFDEVILHLILAVIPNPVACIEEAERVLKPGGQMVVYDKFVKKNRPVSFYRRLLNPLTNLLFSDITRNFEDLVAHTRLQIISEEDADLKGSFRRIKLIKPL